MSLRLASSEGLSGLAGLAAREQPEPRPRGQEVTPWLLGWLAAHGAPADVVDAVRARDRLGRERYGQPLRTGDGRDVVADLAQELADALMYGASAKMRGLDLSQVAPLLETLNRLLGRPG